jgi:hypothetical protein
MLKENENSILIYSEDPKEHWQFLNCKNERIIDFGCCYNDRDEQNTRKNKLGTPQYIVSQNPAFYVGVDIYQPDLIELKNEMQKENVIFLEIKIDSTKKLQNLFDEYLPTAIKMDIEGAEIYLSETNPPACLKQLAIESHSFEIENSLLEWSKQHNYNLIKTQALAQHPHIKILYFSK